MAYEATTATGNHFRRSISLTDLKTSNSISDAVERDLTLPAERKYRFFLNLTKHDLVLPSLSRFDQDFRKFFFAHLVDFDLLKGLQEARCLNWCPKLPKFLAVLTLADGNCLMNAVSLAMWAVNDRRLTLRKTVYQVLIEDNTDAFRRRWEVESKQNLADHNGSSVSCSREQWDTDWKKTVELASPKKSPETNCFSGLEEIHVFVLTNILRRPIIVVCDDVLRGNQDESLANVELGGVYLPLLCDSVDCIKSPLVIGYQNGHFTALVTTEDGGKEISNQNVMWENKSAVPLVKFDGAPMKLHFLLPEEKQHSDRLLREYLNCLKVNCQAENDGATTSTVLVAVMQFQEPEPHLDRMFRMYFDALQVLYSEVLAEKMSARQQQGTGSRFGQPMTSAAPTSTRMQFQGHSGPCCSSHKKCNTPKCSNYTSTSVDFNCFNCKEKTSRKCVSPECGYIGIPEQEGMCSVCFARYRVVLEQKSSQPAPSAPPPPSGPCRTQGCTNQASALLYGWCVTCYLSAREHMNAEQLMKMTHETKSGGNIASTVPKYCRQASLFCHNQDCRNELEAPENIYCNECIANMPGNTASDPAPKCDFPGCLNFLSSANSTGLCSGCITQLQTPQQPSPPAGQPSSALVFDVCKVSSCNMPAVTYHGELCFAHYKQSQDIHRTEDCQRNCDHKSKDSSMTQCINNGCPFYGSAETNYLCSSCHAKALQDLYDLKVIREEQERTRREWLARNVQLSEQMAPNVTQYQFHRDTINPNSLSGMSTGFRSNPVPSSQPPKLRWPAATTPCATQGCAHFCARENQHFCDKCLEKREFGRSVDPGRSRFYSDP